MKRISSIWEFRNLHFILATNSCILLFTCHSNKDICAMMMPTMVGRICKEHPTINVYHIANVPDVATAYKVEKFPTTIYIDNGRILGRDEGVISHMEMVTKINGLFQKEVK